MTISRDTIFAKASGGGKSGVAVYRISGRDALEFANKIVSQPLKHRVAIFAQIHDNRTQEFIDEGLVIYFQAPHSFTGEDVVEFHLHGSLAVTKIFTELVLSQPNIRLAEPGEFAKRAFLNGKMDLTSAEGLADLIHAETKLQHKQAARQMQGELEKLYSGWREILLKIQALLEAYIDFPDEDIPESVLNNMQETISKLKTQLNDHLDDNNRGEKLKNGLSLSIFGPPNVGKSSLINLLAKKDIAIVSDIAGTTRDVIETYMDIGGFPILLADTAGIRDGGDIIEQEGIKRAQKKTLEADIKILVLDATSQTRIDQEILDMIDEETIIFFNKIDILHSKINVNFESIRSNFKISGSVKSGDSILELICVIEHHAQKIAMPLEMPAITRIRHRVNIKKSLEHIKNAELVEDLVLKAEEIRMAARYLNILTGKIDVEMILGEIFSNFCIGK